MNNMFRVVFIFSLAIIVHIVLAAPTDQNNKFDKISYEIENTVKNITEIFDIDVDAINKVKDYVENIIDNIKKRGNVTIESINKLKTKLWKTGENIKSITKAKASNAYDGFIETVSIYSEITDRELNNFLDDIKPNLNKIEDSVVSTFGTVADNVGSILDNFVNRVNYMVNGSKKEQ